MCCLNSISSICGKAETLSCAAQEGADAVRDALQTRLNSSEDAVRRSKASLEVKAHEVEQLVRRLSEKDRTVADERADFQATIETLQTVLGSAQVTPVLNSVTQTLWQ